MRRLVVLTAVALALTVVSSASGASVFVVSGRGWGHSVGMSQWGAYALAKAGWTHAQILAHYYRGTGIATASGVKVRVLLDSGRSSLTIGSAASFEAGRRTVAPGDYRVTPTSDGRIRVAGVGKFATPLRFSPGSAFLEHANAPYRGYVDVRAESGRLSVRNVLRREPYLRGVVPREVPYTWPAAALQAQAVAARSWLMRSVRPTQWFDVYDDTRSQVYAGVGAEKDTTTNAVEATNGQVLVYDGDVAQAFYHSSSGGRTAASVDVWGGVVPYLQSVEDYDLTVAENPHRAWKVVLTGRQLGSRLGTPAPRDATLTRDGSRLAQALTIQGPGWSRTIEGSETLRGRLGVKSARFWVGVLALERKPRKIVWGRSATLTMLVRGVRNVVLEARPYGESWETLGAVAAGTTVLSVKPRKTTTYRLKAPAATGAAVGVRVAANVRLTSASTSALAGRVRPLSLAGALVRIERRRDGSWAQVATATVRADGTFRASLGVAAGKYRARVAPPPSSGLVAGVSPTLAVSS